MKKYRMSTITAIIKKNVIICYHGDYDQLLHLINVLIIPITITGIICCGPVTPFFICLHPTVLRTHAEYTALMDSLLC